MPIITESNRLSRAMQRSHIEKMGLDVPVNVFDVVRLMVNAERSAEEVGMVVMRHARKFEPSQQ